MSQISCQLVANENNSEEKQALTVGDPFYFLCQGSTEAPFGVDLKDPIELKLDKQDEYKLELLKYEFKNENEFRLQVRSLKAGNHDLNHVQLIDATHSLVINKIQFQVQSVLDPNQKTEPYGPMGPLRINYPLILWALASAVVFSMVLALGWMIFRKWKFKKNLKKMNFDQYARSPLSDFYFHTRQLSRELDRKVIDENSHKILSELETKLLVYLGRTFNIPTLFMSETQILNILNKEFKKMDDQTANKLQLSQNLKNLKSYLNETRRLKSMSKSCQSTDINQILNQSRKIVDGIELFKKARSV